MKRILFISAAVLLSTLRLSAQTTSEARAIRTTALQVYDRYVNVMSRLHDGSLSNENSFRNLFPEDKDSLYNDILPNDKPRYLTPERYFQTYTSVVKNASYSYSSFRLGIPQSSGNQWSITIYFTRECSYSTPEVKLPTWSFQYIVRVVMDKQSNSDHIYNNAHISSIVVKNPFQNLVVVVNPQRVPLKWQGSLIYDYDPDCGCWMSDLGRSNVREITSEVDNPFFTLMLDRKDNIYTYKRQRYDLVGGTVAFAPFGFGNSLDGQFADIKGSNNSFLVRAFYGLNLLSDNRNAGFLNFGLEFTNKNFSYDGFFETHYAATDADGDPYTRNINANLIDESWHSFGITVPVTFSYLFNLTPGARNHFYLSAEAGLYATLRFAQSCSYNLSARYTGTYPQYFNVEMDHYYDYGDFRLDESSVEPDKGTKAFDLGVSLGIGLWYQLNEQSFLRFDISARKGFMSQTDYLSNYVLTPDATHYTPVLRSSDNGLLDTFVGLSFIWLRPASK